MTNDYWVRNGDLEVSFLSNIVFLRLERNMKNYLQCMAARLCSLLWLGLHSLSLMNYGVAA